MKRLIALFAVLLLVFAFGCAKEEPVTTAPEPTTPPSMEDVAGTPMEDTEPAEPSAPASGDIQILGIHQMDPMELTVRAGAEIVFTKVGNEDRNFRVNIRTAETKKDVEGSGEQLHGTNSEWRVVIDEPGTYYYKETKYGGEDGVLIVE